MEIARKRRVLTLPRSSPSRRDAPRHVARRFPELPRDGGRRLAEPGGHCSAASARGPRSISPRIYGPSAEHRGEKSREKGDAAHGDTWAGMRGHARRPARVFPTCVRSGKREARPRRAAARPPVAAPRGFFLDPRARFYSAHGKQFCPIINRAIVGGWLYARGAFHTSECNGNQIERRRARGPSAGVNTR